jgi:siroheme synthase (precorrin-2 oxidase/ferrochelatase)
MEWIRSGSEEAELMLSWALLRLAARLRRRMESWLPRELALEMRVLEELRAEPREKLEER